MRQVSCYWQENQQKRLLENQQHHVSSGNYLILILDFSQLFSIKANTSQTIVSCVPALRFGSILAAKKTPAFLIAELRSESVGLWHFCKQN